MFSTNFTHQDALAKANALHTAILTSANLSIIATDEKGVIQLFNRGAQRMMGYTAAEVVNQMPPCKMLDSGEEALRALNLSAELKIPVTAGFEAMTYKASRGLEDIFETIGICKDGTRLPLIVSITALREPLGRLIGYLVMGSDNSLRKRAESEIQQAMHAVEMASKAKSEFISQMSHELRTPLNAILGFAQLIETGNPKPTASQHKHVAQILKGGWYLLDLINEILDLALVESGRLVLSMEPVSVADVLQECRTMIEPLAEGYNVHMVFAELSSPHFVVADHTRFKQAMINLLMNAMKYNRPGGVVSVSAALSAHDGNSLRIQVRDTGIGMTPSQLAQLFQPFNRLGKEACNVEGTGIGLVVTQRLIHLMGGQIGVESTVGVGTLFWLDLPLTTAPALNGEEGPPVARTPPKTEAETASYSVLYVEDNPANLDLVEQLIARRADIHFFSAAEAGIGIALARSHRPDVILMDINLPGISGMDAMQILRADPRTAHIPILALSANAVPRDIAHALAAGFDDYITKPIKVNTLMQSLDAALRLSKTSAPLTTTKTKENT